MKIKDYISKSIQTYPSLFKSNNYEESKLKVLNQIFFVIGNGMEMAWTENPAEGGYVTEPKMKKDRKKDEWVRIYDKPYGKEKFKPIPDSYFEDVVFYVSSESSALEILTNCGGYRFLARFDKQTAVNKYFSPRLVEAKADDAFYPYPFSKGNSIACDVFYNKLFLQDDWKEELFFLCRRTLQFFEDEEQLKNDFYFPNEKRINRDIRHFNEVFSKEGSVGVQRLRKLWDYDYLDIVPTYEEIKTKKWVEFENYKIKQVEFLKAFLSA